MTQSKNRLFTIWLILIVLAVSTLLAEIGMRVYHLTRNRTRYVYIPHLSSGYVLSSNNRFEWYGNDNHPEFRTQQKTNSFGLMGEDIKLKKPEDTFRILVLGDSFTEAMQVAPENSYVRKLESLLNNASNQSPRFEVLNAGTRAYSPINHYFNFKNRWARLKPDLVIVQMFANDLADDNHTRARSHVDRFGLPTKINRFFTEEAINNHWKEETIHPLIEGLHHGLINTSRLYEYVCVQILKSQKKSEPNKTMRDKQQFSPGYQFFGIKYGQGSQSDTLFGEKGFLKRTWRDTSKYLLSLKRLVDRSGAKFMMVYVPLEAQLKLESYGEHSKLFFFSQQAGRYFNDQLKMFADTYQVPFIDMQPVLQQNSEEPLYFSYDGHFNEKGHAIVAQELYTHLRRDNPRVVPTSP